MPNTVYGGESGAGVYARFRLETPSDCEYDSCLAEGTNFDPGDIDGITPLSAGGYANYCRVVLTQEGSQKIGVPNLGLKLFNAEGSLSYSKEELWRVARGEFDKLNELGGANGYLPKAYAFGSYSDGAEDPCPAIVMEHFGDRKTLSTARKLAGRISPQDALRAICKVAWAISCMHDAHCVKGSVVHRDLSPKNFCVEDERGEEDRWLIKNVSIIDLGQAKNKDSHTQTYNTGIGRPATLRYCAPEADVDFLYGKHKKDPQQQQASQHPLVDLWSFGALAVFVWTGENPSFGFLDNGLDDSVVIKRKKERSFHLGLKGSIDRIKDPSLREWIAGQREFNEALSKLIAQWTNWNPDERVADSSYRDTPMKDALRDLKKLCNQFNVEWDPKSDREKEHEKELHGEIPNETPSKPAFEEERAKAGAEAKRREEERAAREKAKAVEEKRLKDAAELERAKAAEAAKAKAEAEAKRAREEAAAKAAEEKRLKDAAEKRKREQAEKAKTEDVRRKKEKKGRGTGPLIFICEILFGIVCLVGLVMAVLNIPACTSELPGNDQAETDSVNDGYQTWGPQDRQTYTWDEQADTRVFNSITDNPSLGDERNFVRIREVGTDNTYSDEIKAEVGKYYEVYVYYHNDALAYLNDSGEGVANNVRLLMDIPAWVDAGKAAEIKGTITASNTEVESVWDCAYLTCDQEINLAYVENSAVIHNGGTADGATIDGTALLSDGVKLAYWSDSWGVIPGGGDFAGYVTFELYVSEGFSYDAEYFADDGEWRGYTTDEVNEGVLGDSVVLNSVTNNPNIGDEREFVGVRKEDGESQGAENTWYQSLPVVDGEEYRIRLFVTAEGAYAAQDVHAAFTCKDSASDQGNGIYCLVLNGWLKSSNTSAGVYRSTAALFSKYPFHVEYVEGSALLENNGTLTGSDGLRISDEVFGRYTEVNYSTKEGELPVGDQYSSYVSVVVKVVFDG